MTTFSHCLSKLLLTLAVFLTASLLSSSSQAIVLTLNWDANGATSGTGGTGTWTSGSTTWNNGTATWSDGADAVFPNTAGTVTISGFTPSANSITFSNSSGNYSITGSTLNITNTSQSIIMATNPSSANGQAINSTIGGTDITVANNYSGGTNPTGRTLLNLNSANTFTASLILGGTGTGTALGNANQVALGHANSLGGPTNTSPVKFARNFSNLLFTSGGAGGAAAYTATYGNDIDLNSTGSTGVNGFTSAIGSAVSGTVITLNGVIKGSGDASLIFTNGLSGGQGKIIIANNATYSGSTAMTMASSTTTSGVIALGINDALPTGTTLTMGNASNAPSGTFDMAGFNQKLGGLQSQGAGGPVSPGTGIIGGITNTTGTMSTLTISGNVTSSYGVNTGTAAQQAAANIGVTQFATTPTALATNSNNIALVLDSANTGTLSLVRPAGNTYNGGTTISGGTLRANNTSGSATGSGAVVVNSGGTLAGTGAVSGAVTVNSGGTLSPGSSVESLGVGTLTLSGASTLKYEIDSSVALTAAADLVNVALGGALSINPAAILSANDVAMTPVALAPGTKFTLASYDQTAGLTGNFAGFPEGSIVPVGLNNFAIHYADMVPGVNFDAPAAGTGFKYVTLTTVAVPEAAPVLMGALVCLVVGLAHYGRKLAAAGARP